MNKAAIRKIIISAIVLAMSLPVLAQSNSETIKTINIDFNDSRPEGVQLNLSLPISFLESFRHQFNDIIQEVSQQETDFDLLAIWTSVRDAGPNQYLTVDGPDGSVNVRTTATHLEFDIDTQEEPNIQVSIPLVLGDAILGNSEVDFDSVIQSLLQLEGQDLIVITSPNINGRVWIQ
jgi:hypothetical protein